MIVEEIKQSVLVAFVQPLNWLLFSELSCDEVRLSLILPETLSEVLEEPIGLLKTAPSLAQGPFFGTTNPNYYGLALHHVRHIKL